MARSLDWNKLRERKLKGEAISADVQERSVRQDKYFKYKSNVNNEKQLLEQGIWPTGKHAGKKLSELSERYLVWAGLNLKSKHTKYAANKELLRRYHSGEIKI
jgi:hypothetical protein